MVGSVAFILFLGIMIINSFLNTIGKSLKYAFSVSHQEDKVRVVVYVDNEFDKHLLMQAISKAITEASGTTMH